MDLALSLDELSNDSNWIKWLKARDVFLGLNFCQKDLILSLSLASESAHPDAVWFVQTLSGLSSEIQVLAALRAASSSVPLSLTLLCFYQSASGSDKAKLLLEAKAAGCLLAEAHLGWWLPDAVPAVSNVEPVAVFFRAERLWPAPEAVELYRYCAKTGLVLAMYFFAHRGFSKEQEMESLTWLLRAAEQRHQTALMEILLLGTGTKTNIIHRVGVALEGRVEANKIFGVFQSAKRVQHANSIVKRLRRDRVLTFLWIAKKQFGLYKDMARLISQYILRN